MSTRQAILQTIVGAILTAIAVYYPNPVCAYLLYAIWTKTPVIPTGIGPPLDDAPEDPPDAP